MPVDLGDFLDNVKREVNPPGTNDFPNATDDEWVGRLRDAFWEARMDGLLAGYTENGGLMTNAVVGGADPTRDLVQVVIFYAGYKALRNALRDLRTQFKATAGPVNFEQQQSANLLVTLLKDLINRRDILMTRLSDLGVIPSYIIDTVQARDDSIRYGDSWWVGG